MPYRIRNQVYRAFAAAAMLLTISCGGNESDGALREYDLTLTVDDSTNIYKFIAATNFDVHVGDKVNFILDNTGALPHDLEVLSPDGKRLGTAAIAHSQQKTEIEVLFEEAGNYRLNCNVDNHLITHQMYAILEVTDPSEPAIT